MTEEDRLGQTVGGKYRIERKLGTGGMGTVWLGRHTSLGTLVAIKFIHSTHADRDDARRRFEIEAKAASRLRSPHVVQVFDYGTDHEIPYIVMEYLEGESLADRIERDGPMKLKEVAHVFRQACKALSQAHPLGIVHRDLKPDNLFLATNVGDLDGPYPYAVKIVDFGIAKILHPETAITSGKFGGPTRAGMVIGTPNFMCPEQLTEGGDPDALSDLWSLGACAFSAVVGRIPFEGETMGDIVLRVCVDPLPIPSRMSQNANALFDTWYARANNRNPRERFQTAEEFSEALDVACGVSHGDGTEIEGNVQYAWKSSGNPVDLSARLSLSPSDLPPPNRGRTFLLFVLVLVVGGAVAFLGSKMNKQPDAPVLPAASVPSASATTSAAPSGSGPVHGP